MVAKIASLALGTAMVFVPNRAPLEPPKTPDSGTITTTSGLKYVEMKIGDGISAMPGNTLDVHYVGTFKDDKKFDSSRDRDQPFTFQLGKGQVIKGWEEGITGMKEGGKRKFIIPPELGYGE